MKEIIKPMSGLNGSSLGNVFANMLQQASPSVIEAKFKKNLRTNELSAYAHDDCGNTMRFEQTPEGIQRISLTHVPPSTQTAERDPAIRRRLKQKPTQVELAVEHDLSQSCISSISHK